MPTAHLIYGYIGSGKTTYAQELERTLPAMRFTTDEWIAKLYDEDESHLQDFRALVSRVEAVMEPLWCRCLELGIDVVVYMGFWARTKRDAARSLAEHLGATAQLHYVHCPDEIAWARVEHRNQDLPGNSIRMVRNTFDVLKVRFEPLGDDEEHVRTETS
ncbi:AAA family ATPase [Tenggerimyces flavus]|uniref:AAA family ATPase n=1 Tax=Tenggerimyces flavus TaxID=1708749 RepID=A0ABV7YKR8_9ACTN|nr:ATP-binding protein [Tenggerimyces flavus]MBM7784909.1 putative kinase [Tenggerimyces flavus]